MDQSPTSVIVAGTVVFGVLAYLAAPDFASSFEISASLLVACVIALIGRVGR